MTKECRNYQISFSHRIQSPSVQVVLSGNVSDYVSLVTHFGFSPTSYYSRA
jgi:hypothetical protein